VAIKRQKKKGEKVGGGLCRVGVALQDMGMLAKTPERWTSCLVSWGRNPRKDCITARGKEKKVRDEEIKLKLLRLTLLHGQLHTKNSFRRT